MRRMRATCGAEEETRGMHSRASPSPGPGLFHGTERNGTERNWGLKYGTEHIRNDRIGLGIGGLTTHGDSSTALAQLHCKLLRS